MKPLRISIGPGDVAGYLAQLANGFRANGIPCEHLLYTPPHVFNLTSAAYFLGDTYNWFASMRSKGRIGRFVAFIGDKGIRMLALLRALATSQVFIFSGYGSFFRFAELPLLRLFGKRVIVVFLGSDARPPYLSGVHLDDKAGVFDPQAVARQARRIARRMRWVERWASVVVNHTGTGQFARRKYVRLSALGPPMGERCTDLPTDQPPKTDGWRVLHAPSRPRGKGSDGFREAIAVLQREGVDISLKELSGVPNSEVLRELAACDFVLDQLYSDMVLSMFPSEAATFGKPAVVGSLYAEEYAKENPGPVPPAFFVHPKDLLATLRTLVSSRNALIDKGNAARTFVREHSAPSKVAERYYRLAIGDIPEDWTIRPDQVHYIGGWGLSEDEWAAQMSQYLEEVGVAGLELSHRPDLESAIQAKVQSARS